MKLWSIFRRPALVEKKSLADPEDWLLDLFGGVPTAAGVTVTAEAALRVPAVASAIRLISEAVASLDVRVAAVGHDSEADDPRNPVLPLLRDHANDWTSGYELIRDLVSDALVSDAGGLAYVVRTSDGRPVELIRYRRGVISVEYHAATGEPSFRIDGNSVAAQNVIHLRPPFGRAPLSLAREAIGVAAVLERHAAQLFGRGARPGGALSFPKGMGEDALKRTRAAWAAANEGGDRAGRTAVLLDGATFEPFTFNSTDSQFLENRKFQIEEIARAFRVPPSMLFHLDRATWSNTEQMGREFLSYTLEPWLLALEGALRRALFLPEERGRFVVRFDRDDLTRADLTTRATAISSFIAARVLSPNEGRAWLDLPPYAGGDEFLNPNISEAANGPQ
jgi:HK97 family phage portal protein